MKNLKFVLILLAMVALLVAACAPVEDGIKGSNMLTPAQFEFLNLLAARAGWLGLVIGLDLVLGITVALKQKIFRWDKLADFLGDYGPKMVAWLALEALGLLPADLQTLAGIGSGLALAAYGLILISAAASVLGHVQAIGILPGILPGVPPTGKNVR